MDKMEEYDALIQSEPLHSPEKKYISCFSRHQEYKIPVYRPYDRVKVLPSSNHRHYSWKCKFLFLLRLDEIVRPWEPSPPQNYHELIYHENPWMLNPPNKLKTISWLLLFFFLVFLSGFISLFLNMTKIPSRLFLLDTTYLIFPLWFYIFFLIISYFGCTISIWFLYLTGGMLKHFYRTIPFFLMLLFNAIWPDVLFSLRLIDVTLGVLVCSFACCVTSICLFSRHMFISSVLLIGILIVNAFEIINVTNFLIKNGSYY